MGKQLNAAEAAVFYTKMRHLFVVDNNRSATAGSRYRIEIKSCLYKTCVRVGFDSISR